MLEQCCTGSHAFSGAWEIEATEWKQGPEWRGFKTNMDWAEVWPRGVALEEVRRR